MKKLILISSAVLISLAAWAGEGEQDQDKVQVEPSAIETLMEILGNPWDCEDNPWGGWSHKC